jgi:hypothetical protein
MAINVDIFSSAGALLEATGVIYLAMNHHNSCNNHFTGTVAVSVGAMGTHRVVTVLVQSTPSHVSSACTILLYICMWLDENEIASR